MKSVISDGALTTNQSTHSQEGNITSFSEVIKYKDTLRSPFLIKHGQNQILVQLH